MKRRVWIIFLVVLCCIAAACTKRSTTDQEVEESKKEQTQIQDKQDDDKEHQEEQTGVKVTVWLDAGCDYLNRYVMGTYQETKQTVAGSDVEQYYQDIQWDLVDKSNLTSEQYRQQLQEALDKGEGPDIIFMDEYNGISPTDMMASGALAEIENPADWYGDTLAYLPGTMEAGQQEGKQYVLPVSVQCPVLFGLEDDLQEAGIDIENGYGSLKELLEALLAAAKKTGRNLFENTAALDWLEQQYVDADDTETLDLLEKARDCCGNDESAFAAYDALNDKTALFGGCGITDGRKMGQNLSLLAKGQQPYFLYVPTADGSRKAVICQSVGINAKSESIAQISKVLLMYRYVINHMNSTGMVPVAEDEYWNDNLNAYVYNIQDLYEKRYASKASELSDKVKRAFKKTVLDSVEGAIYMACLQEDGQMEQETAGQSEKQVITVLYEDMGLGKDSAVTQWLRQAADSYNAEQDAYYVHLMPTGEAIMSYTYSKMAAGGTEPDLVLFSQNSLTSYGTQCADVSDYLIQYSKDLSFLPDSAAEGIECNQMIAGLPYAVKEYGVWCNKKTLLNAGLTEGWEPKNLQELVDGFRKLKEAQGIKTAAALTGESYMRMLYTFMDPEHLDTYLAQDAQGEWKVSAQTWEEFMKILQQIRDEELAVPLGMRTADIAEEEAAAGLAEGTVGAVFADSAFGGWYDSAHGLELADGQREQLVFVPLCPMAYMDMFCISASSKHPEAAAAFWKSALLQDSYAQMVSDNGMLPLMQTSETVQAAMPCQKGEAYVDDIVAGLWQMEKSADEIAEKNQWFGSMEK